MRVFALRTMTDDWEELGQSSDGGGGNDALSPKAAYHLASGIC